MLNGKSLRKFQRDVETSQSLREVLTQLYPSYVEQYFRFKEKVGPHCAFCRASAKFMFLSETNRNVDFLRRFNNSDLGNYTL